MKRVGRPGGERSWRGLVGALRWCCAGAHCTHTAPCVCLQLTSGMAATVGALVGAGAVGTTAAGPAISAGAVGVCPMTWCVARICCSHIWWLIAPVDVMGGPLRNRVLCTTSRILRREYELEVSVGFYWHERDTSLFARRSGARLAGGGGASFPTSHQYTRMNRGL